MQKRPFFFVMVLLFVAIAGFFIHQAMNSHFRPMTNFGFGRTVCLDMDLENAVTDGIYLPSAKQTKDSSGVLKFRFITLKKGLFYKIYYQNHQE